MPPNHVQPVLDRFLAQRGLSGAWSQKRKGWIIQCPGTCEHTDRMRRDETILYTTPKSNGFLYISAKCRHTSCGNHLMEWCNQLNKEWGKYFYECQYAGNTRKQGGQKHTLRLSPVISPVSSIPDAKPLDTVGEGVLSFMAKEQAETLLHQVEDMNAELSVLRKRCWRNSQRWKQYNDIKYRFTNDYWKYRQAWKPYYDLRESRDRMLARLSQLNAYTS